MNGSPSPRLALFAVGAFTMAGAAQAFAQDRAAKTGPIIEDFGATFDVAAPGFATPLDMTYRIVFEVHTDGDDPATVNRSLNTVARFLNMHARAGVPADSMELAVVLHGSAAKNALGHAGFRRRYGVENPNIPLLNALHGAGVEIVLCGQSASARGFERHELTEVVQLGLSALTAVMAYTGRGYTLLDW